MDVTQKTIGQKLASMAVPLVVAVTLIASLGGVLILQNGGPGPTPTFGMQRFSSEGELLGYLQEGGQTSNSGHVVAVQFGAESGDGAVPGGAERLGGDATAGAGADAGATTSAPGGFSGTNNQVAGVDEADIVKTDGQNLYVVSGGDIVILKARPAAEAEVASRIETDSWSTDLFVHDGRLIVISHGFWAYYWGEVDLIRGDPAVGGCMECEFAPVAYPYQTLVRVYDVTDPYHPEMTQNVSLTGWYAGSRMIGTWAYILTTEYLWVNGEDVVLPATTVDGEDVTIEASDVGYFDDGIYAGTLLTVFALNPHDATAWSRDAYLVSGVQSLMVSTENLYVTAMTYSEDWTNEVTAVHRISLREGQIAYEASGSVSGWVLGQYSMDEWNGHLRIATSGGWGESATNRVYVLDMNLQVVGKLEGIAPGERLFAARFLGARGYLVTFLQIDPFFVIDLANPAEPKVLGELQIPGFSTYLHPYDENHILGLGSGPCSEDQAWSGCVKLSLFDVTDVAYPTELSRYVVASNGGSYSEAQWDPKGFLFSKEKDLLVIPVQTWSYTIVPGEGGGSDPTCDGTNRDENCTYVWDQYYYSGWSGVYVFRVTLDGGFELRGEITHQDENATQEDGYWYYGPAVRRSLYIEDDLYTVSDRLVKINALADLSEIKAVPLDG